MTEKRPDQEALQQILGKTHGHGGNEQMRVVKVSVSGKKYQWPMSSGFRTFCI